MIYKFKCTVGDKKNKTVKEMLITSDTTAQFYQRVLKQYGLTKDQIEIIEEIPESSISDEQFNNYRAIKSKRNKN